MNVLPKGLHRIRHYDLFAGPARAVHLARMRELLTARATPAIVAWTPDFRVKCQRTAPRTRYGSERSMPAWLRPTRSANVTAAAANRRCGLGDAGHATFAAKVREWLKTLRKANCAVVLATQSLSDAARSDQLDVLLESCPTKILLPNEEAGRGGTDQGWGHATSTPCSV